MQRAIARAQLMQSQAGARTPRTIGEGLTAFGAHIGAGLAQRGANRMQDEYKANQADLIAKAQAAQAAGNTDQAMGYYAQASDNPTALAIAELQRKALWDRQDDQRAEDRAHDLYLRNLDAAARAAAKDPLAEYVKRQENLAKVGLKENPDGSTGYLHSFDRVVTPGEVDVQKALEDPEFNNIWAFGKAAAGVPSWIGRKMSGLTSYGVADLGGYVVNEPALKAGRIMDQSAQKFVDIYNVHPEINRQLRAGSQEELKALHPGWALNNKGKAVTSLQGGPVLMEQFAAFEQKLVNDLNWHTEQAQKFGIMDEKTRQKHAYRANELTRYLNEHWKKPTNFDYDQHSVYEPWPKPQDALSSLNNWVSGLGGSQPKTSLEYEGQFAGQTDYNGQQLPVYPSKQHAKIGHSGQGPYAFVAENGEVIIIDPSKASGQ